MKKAKAATKHDVHVLAVAVEIVAAAAVAERIWSSGREGSRVG